jgi:phosphotriesterase-related protein
MTVRGPVDATEIGPTSMHEHVFVDCAEAWYEPDPTVPQELADAAMEPRLGGVARWNTFAIRDNLILSPADYDVLSAEVADFKASGGSCIVDVTNVGLGPQPELLRQMAVELDLHIVAGGGFYVADAHPPWLADKSTDEIEELIHIEVFEGIAGTDVRPGVIGELGTSQTLDATEIRVLEAAARVATASGLAVNIHTYPPQLSDAMRILDTLAGAGLDPARVYLSHLEETGDGQYLKAVLDTGATIGFDGFGQDFYFTATWKASSDNERLQLLADLIHDGYEDQFVVGQDVCMKCMLKHFGGMGYDHVVMRVLPRLREAFGVTDDVIEKLLVANPRRLLANTSV